MLEYCWVFAVFLRSARRFTGAEGKWTPLPPISPPSSQDFNFIFIKKNVKNNLTIARGEWGGDSGERGLQELL